MKLTSKEIRLLQQALSAYSINNDMYISKLYHKLYVEQNNMYIRELMKKGIEK